MSRGVLSASHDRSRLVLRAELRHGSDVVISYAFDVAACSAFVATDWVAPIGTELSLRLSFPRVLEPVELIATIEEYCAPSGPGAPAALRLGFAHAPALTELVERSNDTSQVSPQPCRVLFVEDNAFIRDVFDYGLRAFFAARGAYTVDHAESVDDAWRHLANATYDVAIVDYYLPVDTGAVLIERMRADERFAGMPTVAISVGGRDAREASLAAGADVFLDKPLVFRDLFSTLRILGQATHVPPNPKKRILVFDDSPMILELTRIALEAAGFAVAVAEDLATFEQHRGSLDPDLILVDVQMPEAFGDDVVLALREGYGVRVPILLVSNLEEAELASRAERSRAAGYVQKNAGISELVRRCKEALEA